MTEGADYKLQLLNEFEVECSICRRFCGHEMRRTR